MDVSKVLKEQIDIAVEEFGQTGVDRSFYIITDTAMNYVEFKFNNAARLENGNTINDALESMEETLAEVSVKMMDVLQHLNKVAYENNYDYYTAELLYDYFERTANDPSTEGPSKAVAKSLALFIEANLQVFRNEVNPVTQTDKEFWSIIDNNMDDDSSQDEKLNGYLNSFIEEEE